MTLSYQFLNCHASDSSAIAADFPVCERQNCLAWSSAFNVLFAMLSDLLITQDAHLDLCQL